MYVPFRSARVLLLQDTNQPCRNEMIVHITHTVRFNVLLVINKLLHVGDARYVNSIKKEYHSRDKLRKKRLSVIALLIIL